MSATKDPEMKKENSYTYWVKPNPQLPNGVEAPCIKPKLISETEKIEFNNGGNNSQWNKSGTWERKEFKPNDVQKYLNLKLIGKVIGNVEISSVIDVEGDSSIVSVQGRKKPGYDLKLKVKIEEADMKAGRGTLQFKELCDYDPDPEMGIVATEPTAFKTAVRKNAGAIAKVVRETIQQFCIDS